MGINAFLLGAHSVNPDIKLKIVWAYTWFDPPKEADAGGGKRVDNCVPVEETAQSLAEKMIGRRVEPIQDRETPMSTQKRLVVSNLSKRSDELHGTDIQDVTFTDPT